LTNMLFFLNIAQPQPAAPTRRTRRRPCDFAYIADENRLDTEPGRERHPRQIFSPPDEIRRRHN
jgi:hypothetical protein